MHAQPRSSQLVKLAAAKRRPLHREPSASEAVALRLLSEQVAIPLDQLARFLAGSPADVAGIVRGLEEAGWVERRCFLVGDCPWFWLSHRGVARAGTGFPQRQPDVAGLAHRRAVNEVRLHLCERAPRGRWVCERAIYRRRDPAEHLPDAVFEVDGERHAIEVELSRKGNREIRRIVAQHSDRYDAVLYFCGHSPYRLLKRVQAEGRWPKLIVRRLPEAALC